MEGSDIQTGTPSNPRKTRSRTGCLSCRVTRIKCGEQQPICQRCAERGLECVYPPPQSAPRRQAQPRPVRSCEACRRRKARCDGTPGETCVACQSRHVRCIWTTAEEREDRSYTRSTSPRQHPHSYPVGPAAGPSSQHEFAMPPSIPTASSTDFVFPTPDQPHPPSAQSTPFNPHVIGSDLEIRSLLRIYFSTVHHFGLLCFIHEPDFWERYEGNKISPTLILIMAASALRFGGIAAGPDDIARADEWAKEAGTRLRNQVFNEYGATELMELVLCQHYDFQSGLYSRGCLMTGMAARMMTFLRLHMLDEVPHPSRKPFLSVETLRRLAWAVWYLDATIDGGSFGFASVCDGSLTIQLPSDERSFLLHQSVPTQPLMPNPHDAGMTYPNHLGLAAYLIRAMQARQILVDVHSRCQRRLIPTGSIADSVNGAIARATMVLDSLPRDLEYNRTLYYAFKDQLPLLVHLHIMRNTARRHMARLRVYAAEYLVDGLAEAERQRKELIDQAISLSNILSDAIEHRVVMDPQMAMHAYNGIEVLLFQPLRHQGDQADLGVTRAQIAACLKPLMVTMRTLAARSELVSLLHPESVNRMIRMGYTDDLTNDDIMAVLKKIHCLATADAEFDFNESFWRYEVSLRQHSADPMAQSPNDRLLEVQTETSPNQSAGVVRMPIIERTGDPSKEDPLTRLQSLLATNSRHNSFSQEDGDAVDGLAQMHNGQSTMQRDFEMMMTLPTGDDNAFPFPWLFTGT